MGPYSAYKRNELESASPEGIMLKLFEGAVVRLKQAQMEYAEGNVLQARELRSRALAIISELDNTLDRENADQRLVDELDALYAYMIRELTKSTMNDDFQALTPVIETLNTLYQAFEEAVRQSKTSEQLVDSADMQRAAATIPSDDKQVEMHG